MTISDNPPPQPIYRSKGLTRSERLLADLGEHAFLNLWSYPNLFYGKRQHGVGDGKELCDMLVVCGDDVIIFSDKAIEWQYDKPVKIAWPRFYRRAIKSAIKQINGANNWIARYPTQIFTDAACTQRLPIELPPLERRRVHGVVVARGAHNAARKILQDDSGSFIVSPLLKGDEPINVDHPAFIPFCVGDANPDGLFVHVFDDVSIRRVLTELDTITDFTTYLNKRAEYIRSGKLMMAQGEEELLATYIIVGSQQNGVYDFEKPRKPRDRDARMVTIQGRWRRYVFSHAYLSKQLANEPSYYWDRLITLFSNHTLAGTSETVSGGRATFEHSERSLRFMALENRFQRRVLGASLYDAMRKAEARGMDRFVRMVLPGKGSATQNLAYVFMILAYPKELETAGKFPGGYEQYRKARVHQLQAYSLATLEEHRDLKTAVGIAFDASSMRTGRTGSSEDLVVVTVKEWTEAMVQDVEQMKIDLDILREDRLEYSGISADEYPPLGESPFKGHKGRRKPKR